MTKKVVSSRSGYTSGKISPNSYKIYNKANAKSLGLGLSTLGHVISVYSVIDSKTQYDQGTMSEARRNYNYVNAGIATLVPRVGLPIAIGDYLGQAYAPEIEHQVTKGELSQALVWIFESFGLEATPPGQ